MNDLLDIVRRLQPPLPWSEGDNIPWHEPGFSERMLAEHLSQAHERASRRFATIDEHIAWIHRTVLDARSGRVLELACGPGLYTHRLARLGCSCVGIDFAPAAIAHARNAAVTERLPCTYQLADVRTHAMGAGFDLVMLIAGQLNVFRRAQAAAILARAHAALEPGGQILLEPQTYKHVFRDGQRRSSWTSSESGLFSTRPHLVLTESFWDAESHTRTDRYLVIDAHTAEVTRHALSYEAYTRAQLTEALTDVGFRDIEFHPSLSGREDPSYPDHYALLARKPR